MPESQLRQRVRGALQRAFPDALVIGWPANFWTGSGWPDLLFLDWPLLLGLEVKQGRRSKPTPVQGARHSLLRKHHVPVYVVHTPPEAVWAITALKEKLPMAFDPSLLAELEAALSEAPAEAPPEPIPTVEIDPDTLDLDASDNGTATVEAPSGMIASPAFPALETLDSDAPAPDIEDLTAALVANEEIAQAQADEAIEAAGKLENVLRDLTVAVQALSEEVARLHALMSPSEAPRRGRKRSA